MPAKTAKKTSGKSLVIVESPAKSKTIKKILGNDFIIEASMGHIRDFPLVFFAVFAGIILSFSLKRST